VKTFFVFLIAALLILRFSFILKAPLYLDEGIYISWANLIHNSKDFAYTSLQDGKTPLYFWLLSFWGPQINNYLLAGRLISIFSGLVTAASWMIIFNKNFKKSFIYLSIFLIAPYGFLVERMALSDSLLIALSSLSLMFIICAKNILENKNKINYYLFYLSMSLSGIALGFSYATKTTTRLFFITYLIIIFSWIFLYCLNKQYKKMITLLIGSIILILFYNEIITYFKVGGYIFWNSIAQKEQLMIYSPSEIITRLTNNPLSAFNYAALFFEYLQKYLSTLLILTTIGIIQIIRKKENQKFIWLIFYFVFVSFAICVSGKVMASRYIYAVYPTLLAISVFGIDYLISIKKKWSTLLLLSIYITTLFQSLPYVFNFEKASYAKDDQQYFVSGNLTALGLNHVMKYFKDKDTTDTLIGLSGSWGIPDGALVLLKEVGIKSQILEKNMILSEKSTENDKCPEKWLKKNNLCFKMEFAHNQEKNKYLYIVANDEMVQKLIELGIKPIYEFNRFKGESKNYFLEVPTELAI
jgi:hypothetical protein